MQELVSVVVSLYKPNLWMLGEQLNSINCQDYDAIEVIVYNDNPDDINRQDFIERYITRFPARYIHGKKNLGYCKAFELLTSEAKGEYIAFCDQDDVWLPNRISECMPAFNRGYALVSCDRAIIDINNHVVTPSWRHSHKHDMAANWNSGDDITPYAAFSCYSIGMATMIRTEIAQAAQPYPEYTGHDSWLALCASATGPCAFIDKPLVCYRRHGNNASGTFSGISSKNDWYEERVKSKELVIKEFVNRFPSNPHVEAIQGFAQARVRRSIPGLLRYSKLAPIVVAFEIALIFIPNRVFEAFLRRGRGCDS